MGFRRQALGLPLEALGTNYLRNFVVILGPIYHPIRNWADPEGELRMGEKITQSADAEYVRARELREALRQGKPPALVEAGETRVREVPLAWDDDHPEIQHAYLEQLIESAPEAIAILDAQERIVRVNGEFTRLFGFAPEEAMGQEISALLVPEEHAIQSKQLYDAVLRGEPVSLETQRLNKDGSRVDVSVSSVLVKVGESTVGIYALYRDIREQKRVQALSSALHRIAERTHASEELPEFFAAVHAIVAELMYARNFYIALYDPESMSLSFPYYVDEQDETVPAKRPRRGLTEYVLRTGDALRATAEEIRQLQLQGHIELNGQTPADWLGVPLRSGNQTFGVVVAQSYQEQIRFRERDREILTFVGQQLASAIEHKKNEEALRRSEARYRSLVQSAVYGIYRASTEGKFLDVNPALIGMLGYETGEQVLALDPKRDVFVRAQDREYLIKQFKLKGQLDGIEVLWKRRDARVITVRVSGRAVSTGQASEPVLEMIAEDVTDRRALEEQFRQAQKMEAVGRLAGGVAHDFNNLLMVVSGYTEVLLEQFEPDDPRQGKIQAIQQAADRATTLTRQLLAFSRKQFLELKVVDVNAIVSDMERLLRPLIGETIELSTRLTSGVGHTRADAGQLEQVIMNLVVNSRDAMPRGGKITIQTSEVTFEPNTSREHGLVAPGSYIVLTVSDNGLGMDAETQSRIFEPFFTTKEKGKGTGLGLSTVYGIVKQSGGYIFADSGAGRGTRFRIYLPRVDDPTESSGTQHTAQVSGGGSETILLVEDEESVRQLVRDTLESRGYKVIEAENGEAGLRASGAHEGTIDMIITDVVMPGISGRELAKRVTEARPETKVLYLSGYTEEAIAHEGALDPGTAFLQKPFTLQVLSRKVREVLRGEHA
jgi:two-component system, cell cycle sensor histidine kinase and response regulator CckA